MKKMISLIMLLAINFGFAQVYSTGNITFKSSFTAKIDVDNDKVTLTTVAPDQVWFAIGFGVKNMKSNGDVFMSNGDEIIDGISKGYQPITTDQEQNWTLVSNTVENGKRTMLATRALKSSDATDYEFKNTASSINLIWALGDQKSYGKHKGGNFGATVAGFTLSNEAFDAKVFKLSPNPMKHTFKLDLPNTINKVNLTVYNVLGKLIHQQIVTPTTNTIDAFSWHNGVYLATITTKTTTFTKKIIKN